MFRYADDFLLLAKTKREAERALKSLAFLAGKAGLELKSESRSHIYDLSSSDQITVLGMECSLMKNGIFSIRPSVNSMEKLLFKLATMDGGDNIVNRAFLTIRGWMSQQSLAYSEPYSRQLIDRIVEEVRKHNLHKVRPVLYDDDDEFPEHPDSRVWQLGDKKAWGQFWRDCHKNTRARLNPTNQPF